MTPSVMMTSLLDKDITFGLQARKRLGRKWQCGFLNNLVRDSQFLEWEGFDVIVEEVKRDNA